MFLPEKVQYSNFFVIPTLRQEIKEKTELINSLYFSFLTCE